MSVVCPRSWAILVSTRSFGSAREGRQRPVDDREVFRTQVVRIAARRQLLRLPGAMGYREPDVADEYAAIARSVIPEIEAACGSPYGDIPEIRGVDNVDMLDALLFTLGLPADALRDFPDAAVDRAQHLGFLHRRGVTMMTGTAVRQAALYVPDAPPLHNGEPHGPAILVNEQAIEYLQRLIPDTTTSALRRRFLAEELVHGWQIGMHPWLAELRRQLDASYADAVRSVVPRSLGQIRGSFHRLGQVARLQAAAGLVSAVLEGHARYVVDILTRSEDGSMSSFDAVNDSARHDRVVLGYSIANPDAVYVRGKHWVDGVIAAGGVEQLNHVFDGPENLPNLAELAQPATWVRRMQQLSDNSLGLT